MSLATFNSSVSKGLEPKAKPEFQPARGLEPGGARPKKGSDSNPETGTYGRLTPALGSGFRIWRWAGVFCVLWIGGAGLMACGGESNAETAARKAFEQARHEHEDHPQDPKATWQFARAAFDLADAVTSSRERADVAQQGIEACNQALKTTPDSAELHYYLGLDQGELARTKMLGALRLVDQMEVEFLKAIELDALFDYAGPDRSLGLLYRDAPAFGSIGSRTKARAHLERAVVLAPGYPENRLNLIESELKWNDRKSARHELRLLEDSWPAARVQFAGLAWTASWTDWDDRLDKIKRTLEEPPRLESPRH